MPKRNVYRWIPLYNNEKEREREFLSVWRGGGGGRRRGYEEFNMDGLSCSVEGGGLNVRAHVRFCSPLPMINHQYLDGIWCQQIESHDAM